MKIKCENLQRENLSCSIGSESINKTQLIDSNNLLLLLVPNQNQKKSEASLIMNYDNDLKHFIGFLFSELRGP